MKVRHDEFVAALVQDVGEPNTAMLDITRRRQMPQPRTRWACLVQEEVSRVVAGSHAFDGDGTIDEGQIAVCGDDHGLPIEGGGGVRVDLDVGAQRWRHEVEGDAHLLVGAGLNVAGCGRARGASLSLDMHEVSVEDRPLHIGLRLGESRAGSRFREAIDNGRVEARNREIYGLEATQGYVYVIIPPVYKVVII